MVLVAGLALQLALAQATADETLERVQVADPYLDLRTGPGRGYPMFYVAERGEWVAIIKRHTDWFKVRLANGKEGWASREQMERTLTEAGVAKTFRDVLYDDYLHRRFEASFSWGQVSGEQIARRDNIQGGTFGFRLNDNLMLEASLAQLSDHLFSANFMYLSLVSEPFPDWRVSPTFGLGFGKAKIEPKATLINTSRIDTKMANVEIGARVYFTQRFFTRLDYRTHLVFVDRLDRTDRYNELSVGVGFFF
jgi:hypothetical protein